MSFFNIMRHRFRSLILFLFIILFSGLGVSVYKETLDNHNHKDCKNCVKDQHQNQLQQNPNYIYVVFFLVFLIVWLMLIKQNDE
jgi:Na+/H+ antiporter NhaC